YLVNKYNINFIETDEVKKLGPVTMAQRALEMLAHCDLIYVSIDVDCIDSRISTGTGTPVPNGLTVEEVKALSASLAKVPRLCAWKSIEINPTFDTEARMDDSAFVVLDATGRSSVDRPVTAG